MHALMQTTAWPALTYLPRHPQMLELPVRAIFLIASCPSPGYAASSPAALPHIAFDSRNMGDLVPVIDSAFEGTRHQVVQFLRLIEALELMFAQELNFKLLVSEFLLVLLRPEGPKVHGLGFVVGIHRRVAAAAAAGFRDAAFVLGRFELVLQLQQKLFRDHYLSALGDLDEARGAVDHWAEVIHALDDIVPVAHGGAPVGTHPELQAAEEQVTLGIFGFTSRRHFQDAFGPVLVEQPLLDVETELHGRGRRGEGDHEAIAVLLDLVPVVRLGEVANHGVVECHGLGHGGGVLLPYCGGFDDVGEDDAQVALGWRRACG